MKNPLFALVLLSPGLAAAADLESTGAAEERACPAVPGIEAALEVAEVLLVGELHGTAESPAFVAAVACQALRTGRSVTVGLEWAESETARVEAFLESEGGLAARDALLAGAIWQARGRAQYGATSEAMVGLLEELRKLRRDGAGIDVFLFNRSGRGEDRDRAMAKALVGRMASSAGDFLVVLTGNIHSRVVPGTPWNPDYQPMGFFMRQAVPDLEILALDVSHAGGTAWVCPSGAPCGPLSQRARGEGVRATFALWFGTDVGPNQHHGWYFVGPITASPPAVRSDE